jgi:hypothetical protein
LSASENGSSGGDWEPATSITAAGTGDGRTSASFARPSSLAAAAADDGDTIFTLLFPLAPIFVTVILVVRFFGEGFFGEGFFGEGWTAGLAFRDGFFLDGITGSIGLLARLEGFGFDRNRDRRGGVGVAGSGDSHNGENPPHQQVYG